MALPATGGVAGRRLCAWAVAPVLGVLLAAALSAPRASASERGASLYLLGSSGPEAAVMPPLKGVYLDNDFYYYTGSASATKRFELGGIVVAGVHGTVPVNFTTVLWAPTTDLFGGTLAVGGALPIGGPQVHVDAIISCPRGRQFSLSRSDSAVLIGDPILTGALGWKQGNFHEQVSTLINVPIGQYRDFRLANLAPHRWAEDVSFAVTWHDDKSGWDASGKAGVTFNGVNGSTDYETGTEAHYEASLEKILSKAFSVGLQAYRFDQLTGDTGPGNRIGPFKGEVTGVGGTAAWNFKLGERPATLRIRGFREFDAVNRLEGSSFFVDLSFPIKVVMPAVPPTAAHP
jgi:hypothetical protein